MASDASPVAVALGKQRSQSLAVAKASLRFILGESGFKQLISREISLGFNKTDHLGESLTTYSNLTRKCFTICGLPVHLLSGSLVCACSGR